MSSGPTKSTHSYFYSHKKSPQLSALSPHHSHSHSSRVSRTRQLIDRSFCSPTVNSIICLCSSLRSWTSGNTHNNISYTDCVPWKKGEQNQHTHLNIRHTQKTQDTQNQNHPMMMVVDDDSSCNNSDGGRPSTADVEVVADPYGYLDDDLWKSPTSTATTLDRVSLVPLRKDYLQNWIKIITKNDKDADDDDGGNTPGMVRLDSARSTSSTVYSTDDSGYTSTGSGRTNDTNV